LEKSAQHTLDLRGVIISFSLLKVSQVFKTIKPGELLEIFCSDPDIQKDLFKILPESSYELTLMEELKEECSYRVQLKKSFK
jgi:TusA-related sulfurtransferase